MNIARVSGIYYSVIYYCDVIVYTTSAHNDWYHTNQFPPIKFDIRYRSIHLTLYTVMINDDKDTPGKCSVFNFVRLILHTSSSM